MKYSFLFCYRNREEHAKLTIHRLHALINQYAFDEFEIIVAEQNDSNPFFRGQLLNEAAKTSTGNVLIFHDIDYTLSHLGDGLKKYYDNISDVFLPIKRVKFVYNNLIPKPLEEVPSGYRTFHEDVGDFWGAVTVFKRSTFFAINGFQSNLVGWGKDDEIIRERLKFYNIPYTRGNGEFYALDHPDSGVPLSNTNFQHNIRVANNFKSYLNFGVNSQKVDTKEIDCPIEYINVDKWIQCTNFKE